MLDEKESEILWEKRPTNALQTKFAAANHARINPQEPGAGAHSTTAAFRHQDPKRAWKKKGEEELTGNHGASQEPGGIDETCSSAHGKEGERTVQTGPSPRKASKSQKASKKEAPLEVEPTSIAIGQ